jgi:pimeloyl-ACP methyl ester carboxylesterase
MSVAARAATWQAEQATLVTASGTLYGTALIPAGQASMPVVLMHAGSGPTDRDGNSKGMPGSNDSLKQLAEALARHGIASVRFDKRGIAASAAAGGAEADMRLEHYIGDAADWVRQLRKDKRFTRVVVAGHSEGSLIGMIAAHQAGADGYVSIAGVAEPADRILSVQLRPRLPPALFAESEAVLVSLKAGKPVPNPPAALAMLYRPSVQPYLISWFKYDPRKELAALSIPVLIAQGGADIQVPAAQAKLLAAAKPGAKLLVIGSMNHVLKTVGPTDAAQKEAYSKPDTPLSGELVDAISEFAKNLP